SQQEWIAEEEWCYKPNEFGKYDKGMKIRPNRKGYRLPTEVEWEHACGAGSETKFFFGEADELLGKYAWYARTSSNAVGRLKPNMFGLFDMLGNVFEWTQDNLPMTATRDIEDTPRDLEVDPPKSCIGRG